MKIRKFMAVHAAACILFIFGGTGFSQDEVDFGSKEISVDDVVQNLDTGNPEKAAEGKAKEGWHGRAIRPSKSEKPKAISMEITFQINSYQLTADARKKLDVVGQAFNSDRLSEYRFVIEGHTDASGDDNYNLRLSRQRANEVKRYLTRYHKVDSDRLEAEGKGEYDLLLKDDPNNGRNRRVKIVNVGN